MSMDDFLAAGGPTADDRARHAGRTSSAWRPSSTALVRAAEQLERELRGREGVEPGGRREVREIAAEPGRPGASGRRSAAARAPAAQPAVRRLELRRRGGAGLAGIDAVAACLGRPPGRRRLRGDAVIDPKQIPLEPANELEGVMVQVAAGTRDEADVLRAPVGQRAAGAAGRAQPSDELRELPAEPGAEVALPVLPAHGRRTVPVYSSEAQMRKRAPQEWSLVRAARHARAAADARGQRRVPAHQSPAAISRRCSTRCRSRRCRGPSPTRRAGVRDATVRTLAPDELPARGARAAARVLRSAARRSARRTPRSWTSGSRSGSLLDPGASSAAVMAAAETELTRSGVPSFGTDGHRRRRPGQARGERCSRAGRSTSGRRSPPARGSRTARRPPGGRS